MRQKIKPAGQQPGQGDKSPATMIAGCLILAALLAAATIWAAPRIYRTALSAFGLDQDALRDIARIEKEMSRPAPQAGVRYGRALSWRVLYKFSGRQEFVGTALTGQFDPDPDPELLLLPMMRPATMVQPNGSTTPLALNYNSYDSRIATWDYNGDGIDELVPDTDLAQYLSPHGIPAPPKPGNLNQSLYTPVLDLQGRIVATLYGHYGPLLWRFSKGEPVRLCLFDNSTPHLRKLILYLPGGRKSGSVALADNWYGDTVTDIDGDGRDELLLNDYYRGVRSDWRMLKPDLTTADLPQLKGMELGEPADVNGDGRLDFFISDKAWLDLHSGKQTRLKFPPGAPAIGSQRGLVSTIAVGGYLGKGSRQIAFFYGPMFQTTSLVIFDAQGACLLYEEMGEDCLALTTWRFGGQDHLVLCTKSRVLIYP